MLPSQLKDFAQSIVAVVFFGSNILFWRESGYFAAAADLKPLLHTWSLAVEEQYYLLFPLFLILLWRFGRNRVFWSVLAIAVVSFLLAEWGWRNKPVANFYLAPTRAWELLAGSICAFLIVGRGRRANNLLSAAGLALIVYAIFGFDDTTPFPSVYTMVPVMGTALIIIFGDARTWVARMLATPPFVGIGLISYSAYLWHQPLFAFARIRSLTEPNQALMMALAVASLALAWATWRWVEQPFRRPGTANILPTRAGVFAVSSAVAAVFVAVGLAGHLGKGFEWRTRGGISLAALEQRVIVNNGLHTDCEGQFNNSQNCTTSLSPNVLLWGDSYAMHLAQGIVASDGDVAMKQHTISACSPIVGVGQFSGKRTMEWAERCIGFNNSVLKWLREANSIDLVILSSPFEGVLDGKLLLEGGNVVVG
jgi:peptidoglycan/LPS O-acetylase OafA/YrhL